MNQQILDEFKKDYGTFEGEVIDTITIGLGKQSDCFCIFDANTKQIIHSHLTEDEAKLLFKELKKRIR